MTEVSGRCACGATTFIATGNIVAGAICYCTNCQRTNGGGPNYTMALTQHSVRVEGHAKTYRHPGGSGSIIEKIYCGDCGVHLYAQGGGNSHLLRVKAGSLDNPALFEPTMQLWTSQAKPWHTLDSNIPSHSENPPGRGPRSPDPGD